MLVFRLIMMLVGLVLGYSAGTVLAVNSAPDSSLLNTICLTLAGTLTGLLLAPRGEKAFSVRASSINDWYQKLSPASVAASTFGLIVALLLSVLIGSLFYRFPFYSWVLHLTATIIFAIFFVTFSVRNAESFGALAFPQVRRKSGGKILDSNVIIDGRVLELIKSGFIDGDLIVPAFILRELQALSDSADTNKRTRGKRGLVVLEELCEVKPIRIEDWDDPNLPSTDDKLLRLARETDAKLITNDGNLGKIAKLHGLSVLNLHEAAVALKPQVQAGDTLMITITKSGQQAGQGIGYMEDGTMIVVEDGLRMRNKSTKVVVVNNVQTNVGRMIFAKLQADE